MEQPRWMVSDKDIEQAWKETEMRLNCPDEKWDKTDDFKFEHYRGMYVYAQRKLFEFILNDPFTNNDRTLVTIETVEKLYKQLLNKIKSMEDQ